MKEFELKNSKWNVVWKYSQNTFIWEKTIIFKNTLNKSRDDFLTFINMFLKKKNWDTKMKLVDEWIINWYKDYIFIYKSSPYVFDKSK